MAWCAGAHIPAGILVVPSHGLLYLRPVDGDAIARPSLQRYNQLFGQPVIGRAEPLTGIEGPELVETPLAHAQQLLQRHFPACDGVRSLAISPDGSLLLPHDQDDTFYLISTADGSETGRPVPPEFVETWALSPSGGLLALAGGESGSSLILLDYSTAAASSPVEPPGAGMIQSLSFSPDGRLLAALSADSVVRLLGVAP